MATYDPNLHVFDPNKCPVPLIERIQDLPVIEVCEIPQAPPPIPECPDLFIPPVVPLPPCPQLTATAQATALQVGLNPSVTVTVTELDPPVSAQQQCPDQACAYNFDFKFQLPIAPCPQIQGAASFVEIVAAGEDPAVEVDVRQVGEPAACQYAFDFRFQLPQTICPQLGAQASLTLDSFVEPSVTVTVTRVDDPDTTCKFNFDFKFQLPDPQCPQVLGTATATVLPSEADPVVELTVTKLPVTPEQECSYEFAFQFQLPRGPQGPQGPCPELSVTATSTGDGNMTVVATKLEGCAYQLAFAFQCQAQQPQCPQINATATATDTAEGFAFTADVEVTKVETADGGCEYNFDFDFGLSGQCQCQDEKVAVTAACGNPGYLFDKFHNTSDTAATDDDPSMVITEEDCKLRVWLDISAIAGYSSGSEQVLTHTAGGGLAWVNVGDCPQV